MKLMAPAKIIGTTAPEKNQSAAPPSAPAPPPSWKTTIVAGAIFLSMLIYCATQIALQGFIAPSAQQKWKYEMVRTDDGRFLTLDKVAGDVQLLEDGIPAAKLRKPLRIIEKMHDGGTIELECIWLRGRIYYRIASNDTIPAEFRSLVTRSGARKLNVALLHGSGIELLRLRNPRLLEEQQNRDMFSGDELCSARQYQAIVKAKRVRFLEDNADVTKLIRTQSLSENFADGSGLEVDTYWRGGRLYFLAKLSNPPKTVQHMIAQKKTAALIEWTINDESSKRALSYSLAANRFDKMADDFVLTYLCSGFIEANHRSIDRNKAKHSFQKNY